MNAFKERGDGDTRVKSEPLGHIARIFSSSLNGDGIRYFKTEGVDFFEMLRSLCRDNPITYGFIRNILLRWYGAIQADPRALSPLDEEQRRKLESYIKSL